MAEEIETDEASWEEIKVTFLFTAITASSFILVYEYSRRIPAVASVFDRRRATKPNRTPPPLMRSRLFEWLFLSTDPAYIEYSDMVHRRDVIKERRRQHAMAQRYEKDSVTGKLFRLPQSFAMGSPWSVATAGTPTTVETITEEEEPKKKKKKNTHGQTRKKDHGSAVESSLLKASTSSSESSVAGSFEAGSKSRSIATRGVRNSALIKNHDRNGAAVEKRVQFHLDVVQNHEILHASSSSDNENSSSSSEDEHVLRSPLSTKSNTSMATNSSIDISPSDGDFSLAQASVTRKKRKGRRRRSGGHNLSRATRTNRLLTPDVVEVNGRRLPASIAEYAISGDLSKEQLDQYEQKLLEMEKEEERKFHERQRELGMKTGNTVGNSSRQSLPDGENELDLIDDDFGLRAPSRLGYLTFTKNGRWSEGWFLGRIFSLSQSSRGFIGEGGPEDFVNEPIGSVRSMISSHRSRSQSSAASRWKGSLANSKYVNRHLKSSSVTDKRPLTISDQELLRCVGLDTFVMIRFLRFGFDVTFYPFLLACLTLFPLYVTNGYEGEVTEDGVEITTEGYFGITINALESGSPRLWVCWAFSVAYFCYVLWRQWVEWETFIALRFDFLANGDVEVDPDWDSDSTSHKKAKNKRLVAVKDDVQLHLEQYRNSCLVEYIPESHRRDQELFDFFNALFPNQVKRAEVLLNATTLTKLIAERKKYIEKYENIYAKHFHSNQRFRRRTENLQQEDVGICSYLFCRCLGRAPKKPPDPKVHVGSFRFPFCCCGKRMAKALPYYLSEIKRLNREVENEHRRILEERQKVEEKDISSNPFATNIAASGMKFVTGLAEYTYVASLSLNGDTPKCRLFGGVIVLSINLSSPSLLCNFCGDLNIWPNVVDVAGDLTCNTGLFCTVIICNTGFIEFKSLTSKQSAIQCNIVGTTNYMLTGSAPDPRDIIWENVTVERSTIWIKKIQCDALLFTGTIFWSFVVTAVTSISNLDQLSQFLPGWLIPEENTLWYGLIQGYLPVVFLELLMLLVPILLRIIGLHFIRFKTQSEVAKFVFNWHFGYRTANLVIIILKNQIIETITAISSNPSAAFTSLVTGISNSSQFFLNNMIVSAGTELMLELSQMPQMVLHLVIHKFIRIEAKSKRALDKLEEPAEFDWGSVVPNFIFAFLVAAVYSTIVPLVLGACAMFFYLATKVYTHQVLFVYSQPYEGGGKLMYDLNRTIFVICYIGIISFSILLSLKMTPIMAPSFFFGMMIITIIVDHKITKKFVQPSITLALTNSRLIDEENKRKKDRQHRYEEYKAEKRRRQAVKDAIANNNTDIPISKLTGGLGKSENYHAGAELVNIGMDLNHSLEDTHSNENPGISDRCKPIQFEVVKEESEEQLRQRRVARLAAAKGNKIAYTGEGEGEAGNSSDYDFYLYRQPQLNQYLWETKPRPYR